MTDPVFRAALDWLDGHEGIYSNDATDRGGETRYGISQKAYPREDIANLSRERAEYLYERDYWLNPGIDELAGARVRIKVFDMAVNFGQSRAIRLLQQSLAALGFALDSDGRIGPQTLKACESNYLAGGEPGLLAALCREQLGRYLDIINRDPSQRKFLLGWARRAYDLPPPLPDDSPTMLAAATYSGASTTSTGG